VRLLQTATMRKTIRGSWTDRGCGVCTQTVQRCKVAFWKHLRQSIKLSGLLGKSSCFFAAPKTHVRLDPSVLPLVSTAAKIVMSYYICYISMRIGLQLLSELSD
jgi:hypothetical protein